MNLQYAPVPSHIPTHSGALCPPAASAPIDIPDGRRNSNGSVKELVYGFEEIEGRALQVRKVMVGRRSLRGSEAFGCPLYLSEHLFHCDAFIIINHGT